MGGRPEGSEEGKEKLGNLSGGPKFKLRRGCSENERVGGSLPYACICNKQRTYISDVYIYMYMNYKYVHLAVHSRVPAWELKQESS